ncbi:putative zinc finger domain-containing protein-containing protein, partial [Clostridium botulinum CFSAN002369]
MNRETCIFNYTKKCTDCGECEICDLDQNKKCDNCGECLQREGIDTQAIKIDEIKEDKNFVDKEDLKKVLKEDEKELESLKEFEEDLENEILQETQLLKDYDENFKEQGLYAIENVEGV